MYGVQALGAAQEAIRKFEAASTPWQRPPDYYAEMVKNDDHMAKVKQQLMHEQEQMEAVEQRCDLVFAADDASTLLLHHSPVLVRLRVYHRHSTLSLISGCDLTFLFANL